MSTLFDGIPEHAKRDDGVYLASSQEESPFADCEFDLVETGELKVWRIANNGQKAEVTDEYLRWVETAPKVFYAKFEWIVDPEDL